MFGKEVLQLQYSDIEDLVLTRKEREGYHLDYKAGIGNADKAKKELAKDISAFANSAGGYLIYGVSNEYQIVGIEKHIQNKPVDEWLNQVVSTNIEPHAFYTDPKIIPIPNSDRVIMVIYVPESSKKPHAVTELNNYFLRINDSCKTATHNQIRDMFDFARNRTDEFISFLKSRNLDDESSQQFGFNSNSVRLNNEIKQKLQRPVPLILYSFIPKYLKEEKLLLPFREFHHWLQENEKGYFPLHNLSVCYPLYDCEIGLDNVVSVHKAGDKPTSYLEIQNNGFLEAGVSKSAVEAFPHRSNVLIGYVNATGIICYEMMLLGFAKKFYELIKYNDEVLFQLSFVNMHDYVLSNLHQKYRIDDRRQQLKNTQHNNFKLRHYFNPSQLSEAYILNIAKNHSEKLCRAFGLDRDYCFVNDELSLNHMNVFRL